MYAFRLFLCTGHVKVSKIWVSLFNFIHFVHKNDNVGFVKMFVVVFHIS